MTIYTTKQDYIAQVIAPALGEYAAEHNIDAIADEMLNWHNGIGQPGNNGFMEDENKDFWAVIEANAAQSQEGNTKVTTTCEWFALCDQPASTTATGPGFTPDGKPAMIEIPICDRCNKKLAAIEN